MIALMPLPGFEVCLDRQLIREVSLVKKQVIGVLFGNRGFFPDHLCAGGKAAFLAALGEFPVEVVTLSEADSASGGVETTDDARRAAALLVARASEIEGLVVSLPNFGDEKSLAQAIRMSGLRVPILVHAFPDDPALMDVAHRRDSFCGKISVCNNLRQLGLPFSLTAEHTLAPGTEAFRREMEDFLAVCRVVRGLRNLRIGVAGTRPADFNTMRYSEKILERCGISVEPLDLSEVLGRAARLSGADPRVGEWAGRLSAFGSKDVPREALTRLAALGVVLNEWIAGKDLQATAVQCWSSLQENYGVVPCALMGLLSAAGLPAACEADVAGAVAMAALRLATGAPSGLVDWNNNYGGEPDHAVVFHCSNLPPAFLEEPRLGYNAIIAGTVGRDNAWGTLTGAMKPGPVTYARVSTDDVTGSVKAYVGEGEVVPKGLATFGGYGVLRVGRLNDLMRYVCREGFEHHVALGYGRVARVLQEAFETYLGWRCHVHI